MSADVTRTGGALVLGLLLMCSSAARAQATLGSGKTSGPQGDSWASVAQLPNWTGAWYNPNFLQRPRSGPQFTAAYQKLAQQAAGDTTIKNNAVACLPDGVPTVMGAPFSFEYLFTPGHVTILSENGEIRRIFTDGRHHTDDGDPTFEGNSIGYWEQGVLYVDTTNIINDAELVRGIHQSGMTHVTERIGLKDAKTLQIDTTVTDPIALTKPYSYSRTYKRTPVGMIEYVCEQNNKGNHEFSDDSSSK